MMPHYEACSCGAAIFTFSMRRVREWRADHAHDVDDHDPPMIFESQGSLAERSWRPPDDTRPVVTMSSSRHVPLGHAI